MRSAVSSPWRAALRAGKRCWPAEIILRGFGLLLLTLCWRLSLMVHDLAITPPPHPASASELGLCALLVLALCGGLTLTGVGPGLLRDVPLPPHFTRYRDNKP